MILPLIPTEDHRTDKVISRGGCVTRQTWGKGGMGSSERFCSVAIVCVVETDACLTLDLARSSVPKCNIAHLTFSK